MLIPVKMTVKLENGCIVEMDFNSETIIKSTSTPLTENEKNGLIFKAGIFFGGGNAALAKFD